MATTTVVIFEDGGLVTTNGHKPTWSSVCARAFRTEEALVDHQEHCYTLHFHTLLEAEQARVDLISLGYYSTTGAMCSLESFYVRVYA